MLTTTKPSIIIDSGSDTTKIGFDYDTHPIEMPTIAAKRKLHTHILLHQQIEWVADEALSKRCPKLYHYPIKNKVIQNWDQMVCIDFIHPCLIYNLMKQQEKIWRYGMKTELDLDMSSDAPHSVLMAVSPNMDTKDRAKIMEIMFESLNVKQLFLKRRGYHYMQQEKLRCCNGCWYNYKYCINDGECIKME